MRDQDLYQHIPNMLAAKNIAESSICQRRKIGVVIPLPPYMENEVATGVNNPATIQFCCSRKTDARICPAVHAEVEALSQINQDIRYDCPTLYIWAEVPCEACLSYLYWHSGIKQIFCLDPYFYGLEYPAVLSRTVELKMRYDMASHLGIDVTKITKEDFDRYELLTTPQKADVQRP